MCGIAVLFDNKSGSQAESWILRMTDKIAHRGPDDSGVESFAGGLPVHVYLGHRRLSILDLSAFGHQPLTNEQSRGKTWITFNGEIYNFIELRRELEVLGHTFASHSDTLVLLAAYRQWGAKMLPRLVGMFAFAILDLERNVLFAARDPFGIKPLYLTRWEGGLAFASEIKALLELPGVRRRVNPALLYSYLRFGMTDQGSESLFEGIFRLPPATYVEFDLKNSTLPEPIQYWRPTASDDSPTPSPDEAARRVRELFVDSVRLQLRSDVPVGSALSGGIDSSAIVMAMRHLEPKLEIHCFSYVADDKKLSEERWIDLVGEKAKATVHKTFATAADLRADLETLIRIQEEPFGTTSIYAQYRVFQKAREAGIKVTLDGQGADEMLGGYPVYRSARMASLVKQGRWGAAKRIATANGGALRSVFSASQFLIPPVLQSPLRRLVGEGLTPDWLDVAWFEKRGVEFASPRERFGKNVLKDELIATMTRTNLPMLLRYADRNSMSHSIESRVPFLTCELVDYLFSLPESYLVGPDGTTKWIFRRAMRGLVPDAVLDRKDKLGFVTPEHDWLMTLAPWVEGVLEANREVAVPGLRADKLKSHWEAIRSGSARFDSRFWRWLNLLVWTKQFNVEFR